MKQVITKVETHDHNNQDNIFQNIARIFFGIIETGLLLRLILKLFGASTGSGFVNFIYKATNFLVKPFVGIINNIKLNNSDPNLITKYSLLVKLITFLISIRLFSISY